MRAAISIFIMLTVAPLVAVTTLVCWNPSRWGGPLSPLAIPVMALFGLFTTPLWPTYIPALALTPLIMRRIAAWRAFRTVPLSLIIGMSLVIGAVAGFGVISIIVPWGDSPDLVKNWLSAGVVSGAITLAIISLVYRWTPDSAEPGAAPNGGPAVPPVISGAASGPPSVS
jgi:hypothetical protein